MADTMRGVYTNLTEIRRNVFSNVAKIAYDMAEDDEKTTRRKIRDLPYEIIPGDVATYRESVFLERAIVEQRIRLAMGLPLQGVDKRESLTDGLADASVPETYYEPPLINVIKFACNACDDNVYRVTNACQSCLAHPCREICPKGAISFRHKKAYIDQEKCIHCGMCFNACPYHAIQHHVRPCADACGMNAIGSDEHGRAQIDYEKCVSCGQCLINCPFGAIADTVRRHRRQEPDLPGHPGHQPRRRGHRRGGAGLRGPEDFMEEVPEKIPFMGTSCCPAWSVMAKTEFPEHAECISMALTPMTLTARLLRQQHPNAKIVFVGPCSAKKLEAMRKSVRSEVDFVLTFEEMAGMMKARGIDEYTKLEGEGSSDFEVASADGRGFAVAGGVANAVVNAIKVMDPEREVNVVNAEGLENCRKMMKDAVKGKYPGYLIEGMACPGGCVAGAGTLQSINKTAAAVRRYAKKSPHANATENAFRDKIPSLEREEDGK